MSNEGNFKYTEQQIRDALLISGTKLGAAAVLKTSRTTINEYIERYPDLENAIVEAKENLVDIAETGLMKNVKAGHPPSISLVLKTLGKDRGYVERIESTGKGGGPIQNQNYDNAKAHAAIDNLTGNTSKSKKVKIKIKIKKKKSTTKTKPKPKAKAKPKPKTKPKAKKKSPNKPKKASKAKK